MSTLFVTSFSPSLYKASAEAFLTSFLRVQRGGEIFVGYEGTMPPLLHSRHIRPHALADDMFLQNWLKANRDIIPVALGGDWPGCQCARRHTRHPEKIAHELFCPGSYFNYHASLFFRKVATLRSALAKARAYTTRLVWLDCDCIMLRPMSGLLLQRLLARRDCAILQGDRRVIEACVMIFDLRKRGSDILEAVFEDYTSGAFRAQKRWDDGNLFTRVLERRKDLTAADLVSGNGGDSKTVPLSALAEYVAHAKGRHTKTGVYNG